MAKSKQVKCPICSKMNDKEDTIKIGNRYYCKECAEHKDEYKSDWDLLFEYICKLYNISKPTGMMFRQLKEFRSEPYCFTDGGMYATLRYYHEILGNNVLDGSGIGIIPYYYDKTRQYYEQMNEVEESLKNHSKDKTNVVNINPSAMEELSKFKIRELSFENIDMEDELKDE